MCGFATVVYRSRASVNECHSAPAIKSVAKSPNKPVALSFSCFAPWRVHSPEDVDLLSAFESGAVDMCRKHETQESSEAACAKHSLGRDAKNHEAIGAQS